MWNDDTAGGTVHQPMTHKESNLTSRNPGENPSSKLLKSRSFAPKNDAFQVRNLLFQGGYVSFREGTLPQTKIDNYHITKPTFIICIPSPITYPSSSTHRVPPPKKVGKQGHWCDFQIAWNADRAKDNASVPL